MTKKPARARRRTAATAAASIHTQLALSYLLPRFCALLVLLCATLARAQSNASLPDLSMTSDEPIVTQVGHDAYIMCKAKNLQNYTLMWRFTNDAKAPGLTAAAAAAGDDAAAATPQLDSDVLLTAGRQRVSADERFTVIQSHDSWLLKISQTRLSDTGTYMCQTNSEPKVRALRVLSVVRPETTDATSPARNNSDIASNEGSRESMFRDVDYNFVDCCRGEFVSSRCQRLCTFQTLASRYQSIHMVHECYSSLPSITRCMVAGRNLTECCARQHIPARCNAMCGHLGDTSAMSVQDQTYCADYSAAIMSCK